MLKQVHILYSGRVQGVGFRYTSVDIARKMGISGSVRNLPDGRVEIFAEGSEDLLKEFLGKIEQVFNRYILEVNVDWSKASGRFNGFGIEF